MQSIKILLAILSATYILSSCSPAYYAPNSHHIPLMEEQGDLAIAANLSNDGKKEGHISYAATNHVGVMLNRMTVKEEHEEYNPSTPISPAGSESNSGKGSMTELGVGYYNRLGNNVTYEVYGIIGKGTLETAFRNSNRSNFGILNSDITKYALQGNLGFKRGIMELAFSIKPTFLKYSNIEGDLVFSNESQIDFLQNNDDVFLVESASVLRLGFKNFKVQLQGGRSNLDDKSSRFGKKSKYFAAGIFINFNVLQSGK